MEKKERCYLMMIDMRDIENNELVSLDILDIDMQLSIVGEPGNYKVKVCKNYVFDGTFNTKDDAERQLKALSLARNNLENELRSYEN